ncbi:MAG: TetR/AcrR family transcriptional regulator [Candidatus Tectomicrobia bacterium]|nr:TetR/AcrR family transcriptional regulator [Candidatus Tectomicrobia bacterium]
MPRVQSKTDILERRRQIAQAASRVFSEKGYDACTLDDIAGLLDLKKPSLYYYIKSKKEILSIVLDFAISEVSSNLEAICQSQVDPAEKLQRAVANHLNTLIRHFHPVRVYHNERKAVSASYLSTYIAKRKNYEVMFKGILREGVQKKLFSVKDTRLTTFMILGMCNWITQWYRPGGPHTLPEIIGEFTAFILRGLGLTGRAEDTNRRRRGRNDGLRSS